MNGDDGEEEEEEEEEEQGLFKADAVPGGGGGDLFRAHAVNDDDDAFNQNAIANAMQDGSERGRRREVQKER